MLFLLLDAVVTVSAKALQITSVPEQLLIATMWFDMITHQLFGLQTNTAALGTGVIKQFKYLSSKLLPSAGLVPLAVRLAIIPET